MTNHRRKAMAMGVLVAQPDFGLEKRRRRLERLAGQIKRDLPLLGTSDGEDAMIATATRVATTAVPALADDPLAPIRLAEVVCKWLRQEEAKRGANN